MPRRTQLKLVMLDLLWNYSTLEAVIEQLLETQPGALSRISKNVLKTLSQWRRTGRRFNELNSSACEIVTVKWAKYLSKGISRANKLDIMNALCWAGCEQMRNAVRQNKNSKIHSLHQESSSAECCWWETFPNARVVWMIHWRNVRQGAPDDNDSIRLVNFGYYLSPMSLMIIWCNEFFLFMVAEGHSWFISNVQQLAVLHNFRNACDTHSSGQKLFRINGFLKVQKTPGHRKKKCENLKCAFDARGLIKTRLVESFLCWANWHFARTIAFRCEYARFSTANNRLFELW